MKDYLLEEDVVTDDDLQNGFNNIIKQMQERGITPNQYRVQRVVVDEDLLDDTPDFDPNLTRL